MSKFDAGTAVEAMEYDFTAYGGGSGTIPEPPDGALKEFFKIIGEMQDEFSSLFNADNPEELAKDSDLDAGEAMSRVNERLGAAVAAVSGNTITTEAFGLLPFRVKQVFIAWLSGELSPEKEAPATKP